MSAKDSNGLELVLFCILVIAGLLIGGAFYTTNNKIEVLASDNAGLTQRVVTLEDNFSLMTRATGTLLRMEDAGCTRGKSEYRKQMERLDNLDDVERVYGICSALRTDATNMPACSEIFDVCDAIACRLSNSSFPRVCGDVDFNLAQAMLVFPPPQFHVLHAYDANGGSDVHTNTQFKMRVPN